MRDKEVTPLLQQKNRLSGFNAVDNKYMISKISKKEKLLGVTIFFFFAIFSFSGKALAYVTGTISLDSGGTVTSQSTPTSTGAYNWYFLGTTTNLVSGTTSLCNTGTDGSGGSTVPSNIFVGRNIYTNGGLGTGDCTAPGDYYAVIQDAAGVNPVDVYVIHYDGTTATTEDNVTKILSTTPANGSQIATSSTNTIGAVGYLLLEDFNDESVLEIEVQNSASYASICGLNPLVSCPNFGSRIDLTFTYPLVIQGYFTYSSTTAALPQGKYYATYKIKKGSYCLGSLCALTTTVYSTTTTFIIASTTKLDKLVQDKENYNSLLSSTTVESFSHCGIGDFDLAYCGKDILVWAFMPTSDTLSYFTNTLHDDILTHFPLGYVTNFVEIISTSTVGTLTPIDTTIPNVMPGGGTRITLDITNSLDPLLNATSGAFTSLNASSTETFYEITSYYWKIIVYLLAFIYMLSRILGSGIINNKHGEKRTDWNTKDKYLT